MTHALHDLVRHNTWATEQIIAYCRQLDEETLNATIPGTYGSIFSTLWHYLASETSYLHRLTGTTPSPPWPEYNTPSLDMLAARAAQLTPIWENFLAQDNIDTERLGEGRGDDGRVFAIRASIFYTQALHHANEHRAHICSIIGALGHEAPDVSAWGYALASGRSWITSEITSA
ncbi:MAG: DinB family protein [Thermomicrobiales bacterium]